MKDIIEDKGIINEEYREYFFKYGAYSEGVKELKNCEFSIGDVKIKIGEPSVDFLEKFPIKEVGSYYETISLDGVTEDSFQEIIEQAFFYITCMNPPLYPEECPELFNICNRVKDFQQMEDIKNFSDSNNVFPHLQYSDAIAFYNFGIGCSSNELSFLYFYKTLEHFFIIHQADMEVRKKNELSQLKSLLKTMESQLIEILNEAKRLELYTGDINEFCKKLYEYRCSIVHGKSGFKEEIVLRARFKPEENDNWNKIIKALAEKIIIRFCIPYDN